MHRHKMRNIAKTNKPSEIYRLFLGFPKKRHFSVSLRNSYLGELNVYEYGQCVLGNYNCYSYVYLSVKTDLFIYTQYVSKLSDRRLNKARHIHKRI